ncbi:MAG: tetratricopeptide repeat protein [Rubrivivax sp.]
MADDRYRYVFEGAELDEARRDVRIGGQVVALQRRPLALLAELLARPRETVTKDELLASVWQGRVVEEAAIVNAVSKLRGALGDALGARVVTVPGEGYRYDGDVRRIAVGRRQHSELALEPGAAVPGRAGHRLVRLLGASTHSETWLAEQPRTGDRRVFKFALDGERLASLKRERTVALALRRALGERPDLTRVLDENFAVAPYWLECEFGGDDLDRWSVSGPEGTNALRALLPAQRLALALQVADALAAAHGVGVVHGDLKPANVLMAPTSGNDPPWQARLTDFGSGHILDPALLERLRITRLGLTLDATGSTSGTPYYIAPELLAGAQATTSSDVYSLGVLLYQLLAADLRQPLTSGWERDIDDELLREDIARATDRDPANRPLTAGVLAAQLRELPQRRARRAADQALAERELADAQRRARERARRPWVIAAMAALAVGAAASTALYVEQRHAADALARQFAVSQALNRLLREDLIGAASPARSGRADITVAEALDTAAGRIDETFAAADGAVRGSLHAAMQGALSDLSRAQESVRAGRRALAAYAQAGEVEPAQRQAVRLRLALDLVQLSRLDEARRVVRDIDTQDAVGDATFRVRLLYVKSWLVGGELAVKESTRLLEEAMRIAAAAPDLDPQVRRVTAFALADSYSMESRLDEAEAVFRRLYAEQAKAFGPEDARTLFTTVGLGRTLGQKGRLDEARTLLLRAAEGLTARLGAGHRQTLDARDQLARLRYLAKDFAGAARDWALVHRGFVALIGAGSSMAITVLTNQAMATHEAGEPARAEPLLRDALAKSRAFLKEDAPQVQQIRAALAGCLLDLQRPAEAAPLLQGLAAEVLNDAQPEPDWPARLAGLRARAGGRQTAVR